MQTWHRNTFTTPFSPQFDQSVQFSQKTVKLNDGFFVQPTAQPNSVGQTAQPNHSFTIVRPIYYLLAAVCGTEWNKLLSPTPLGKLPSRTTALPSFGQSITFSLQFVEQSGTNCQAQRSWANCPAGLQLYRRSANPLPSRCSLWNRVEQTAKPNGVGPTAQPNGVGPGPKK
jgi:hypothetical protein